MKYIIIQIKIQLRKQFKKQTRKNEIVMVKYY